MSLAEHLPSKLDGRGSFASTLAHPREAIEKLAGSPQPSLRMRAGKGLTIHTDRVRAKPAISPTLSMNIGVTAIGLGFWGALFPHHVKRTLGLRAPAGLVQAVFGLRELVTGFTLAGDPTKHEMLWARVAGDIFDIAVLKGLDDRRNPQRGAARAALAFVVAVTALDLVTAIRMTNVQRNCE